MVIELQRNLKLRKLACAATRTKQAISAPEQLHETLCVLACKGFDYLCTFDVKKII